MDANTAITIISSVGFPIFACLFLGWFIYKVVEDLRKTVEHNTTIMEKILTKLDMEEADDGK